MFRFLQHVFAGKAVSSKVPSESIFAPSSPEEPSPVERTAEAAPASSTPAPKSQEPPITLALPIVSILSRLPKYLTPLVQRHDPQSVLVPLTLILPQLPNGIVQLSFGQLRQLAALGTFTDNQNFDTETVVIPLHEVLKRIDPVYFTRRPQIRFVAPEGVPSLFVKGSPPEKAPFLDAFDHTALECAGGKVN